MKNLVYRYRLLICALLGLTFYSCSPLPCPSSKVIDDRVVLTVVLANGQLTGSAEVGGTPQGNPVSVPAPGVGGDWCNANLLAVRFRQAIRRMIADNNPNACAACPVTGGPCKLVVTTVNKNCSYSLSRDGSTCSISCPKGSVTARCRKCNERFPICDANSRLMSDSQKLNRQGDTDEDILCFEGPYDEATADEDFCDFEEEELSIYYAEDVRNTF